MVTSMRDTSGLFDGFPISEIARICRVSLKTARRWKAGSTCPPAYAILILRGDLGALDTAWAGWLVRRGKLLSPEGYEAIPGDVRALPFMRMQIQTYQLEFRRMTDPQMEDQPLPESWSPELKELLG